MLERGRRAPVFDITEEHLARLPEPVRKYLRAVGVVGRRNIRTVHLTQSGSMRRKPGEKWMPFAAEQWFTTDPPGFVWDARIRFLPLLSFSVTDKFVDGRGRLEAKLLSVFKVADASGPEVDQGELLRYLGEMAWFPTVWLSVNVECESIDDRSVNVTMRQPGCAASAVIHFDGEGRVSRVSAERYAEENGKHPLRKWSGRFSDYRRVNGLLIPTKASVSWHLDSGDLEYFRSELGRVEYDG
jgi:hypothetical protein